MTERITEPRPAWALLDTDREPRMDLVESARGKIANGELDTPEVTAAMVHEVAKEIDSGAYDSPPVHHRAFWPALVVVIAIAGWGLVALCKVLL